MGFLSDAPSSIKGMVCVFQELGEYRWDVADVFRDFIDYSTACFLFHGDLALAESLKKKYKEDYPKLGALFQAWIQTMNERITGSVLWFDALGTLYEYINSRSKASWLGQFFTPDHLCNMMTFITCGTETFKGKKVNDPACGSGRTLLSFNSRHPGNMLYGEDLDPICAKMTALNMAIHGCQGQVTCMDSLNQNWNFCYEINPYHRLGAPAIPHILPVSESGCYSKLQVVAKAKPTPIKRVVVPEFQGNTLEPVLSKNGHGQLALF